MTIGIFKEWMLVTGSPCLTKALSYGNDSLYKAIANCFLYRGAQFENKWLSLIKAAFSSKLFNYMNI
jgi:hypothetical protein